MQETRIGIENEYGLSIPVIWNVSKAHKAIVLCLHGFAGDKESSVIAALMQRLDEKDIGIVTFDWPAHGESKAPDSNLTVENCLADLDMVYKFIVEKEHKLISCFATSFGGYLATLYRNEHLEAFSKIVLRSPALNMGKIFRGFLTENEFNDLMRGGKTIQGFERKMYLGKEFYDSLLAHDAFSPDPPYPEKVLILQGDKDDVVNPEDTIEYARRNRIRIEIFEGTDHLYKRPGEKEKIVEVAEGFLLE